MKQILNSSGSIVAHTTIVYGYSPDGNVLIQEDENDNERFARFDADSRAAYARPTRRRSDVAREPVPPGFHHEEIQSSIRRGRGPARLEPPQTKRVGNDRHAREGHGGTGDDWIEQAHGGERECGDVVAEGPAEVLLDRAQRRAGQADRVA